MMEPSSWNEVVERLAENELRIYLTGRVGLEQGVWIDQDELGGRQGRLAFVRLVLARHRPLPIDRLAEALWGEAFPPTWQTSLRAVVSRLRRTLLPVAPDGILSDGGCYQLVVPGAWVDIEAAANAVDRAEGALRQGDLAGAWSESTVAAGIAGRPVLPGEDRAWVEQVRTRMRSCDVRALDVLLEVYLADGQYPLALAIARELVTLEPLREAGHRGLMRALVAAGERARALRVYRDLRELLVEELGVEPSHETERLYLAVLRAGGVSSVPAPPVTAV